MYIKIIRDMRKEKGVIEGNKMLTGFNAKGVEIWKTIPAVRHSFKVGDVVEYINYDGITEIGVVEDINCISKKYPYNTNSSLEISILVRFANSESVAKFSQEDVSGIKKVAKRLG
jgi:hypothetical protein